MLKINLQLLAATIALAILTSVGISAYSRDAAGKDLPILMYHHFAGEVTADTVVTGQRFREQMTALRDAGYQAVSVQQLIDYVDSGTPLPDKPVLITMDDGYTSNLEIAAPILDETGMQATVFVIGINEGETVYVHTGEPFWLPRFSYEDAFPWVEKGILDMQSHSMDMHQLESYGYSGRDGMLSKSGESDEEYRQAIADDAEQFRQRREGRVPTELCALAYPFGYYSQELDSLLADEGIAVTLTTDSHSNKLKTGDRSMLRGMGRYNVTERMTGEALVSLLAQAR